MLTLCIILDKPFFPSTLLEWTQFLSFMLSGAGILIAAISYANTKKLKRAEWLKSLFEKFYENPNYKNARR